MTTPAPSPDFPQPTAPPTPPPAPAMPSGPVCAACGAEAVVNWRRRPTDDELAEVIRVEQERRAQVRLDADPHLPPPTFGPLPPGDDMTRTLYACGPHAITMDAAALIHQSGCTAPNDADLPGCNCTPETLPAADEEPAENRLPAHWLPGGE